MIIIHFFENAFVFLDSDAIMVCLVQGYFWQVVHKRIPCVKRAQIILLLLGNSVQFCATLFGFSPPLFKVVVSTTPSEPHMSSFLLCVYTWIWSRVVTLFAKSRCEPSHYLPCARTRILRPWREKKSIMILSISVLFGFFFAFFILT